MAKPETHVFDDQLVALAELAKALGHPARLRILEILAQTSGCLCGDLVDRLPLAQATVSQHLKELKRVGLIQGQISGPRTCYCLNPATLDTARERFALLFAGMDCCRTEGISHEDSTA
jgi:predicted transcriptional regulator